MSSRKGPVTTAPPSGGSVNVIENGGWTPYKTDREGAIAPVFPPLQVAQIVALACSPPSDYGLALQRWTYRDLQYQILSEGIVTEPG